MGPRRWWNALSALTIMIEKGSMMAETPLKTCTCCKQARPHDDFSPDRRNKDGLQSRCRECSRAASKAARDADPERARAKERAYFAKNRQRVLESNNRSRVKNADKVKACKKAWYEKVKNDPSFKAKLKARQEANKDAKREYDRAYRAKNPEVQAQRAREWVSRNPEKRAAIVRNYRDRRRAQTSGGISTAELAAWTDQQKKVCYWCGTKCAKGFHVDHYVPLARGGLHEASNLVISCAPCNLKKNAKDPLDFAREIGRLM